MAGVAEWWSDEQSGSGGDAAVDAPRPVGRAKSASRGPSSSVQKTPGPLFCFPWNSTGTRRKQWGNAPLAIEVHRVLGPGLLESAYEECLLYKIGKAGLFVEHQKPMPLVFEEVHLECGYRIDILVEHRLVLEIKSVDAIHPIFLAQTLTYMRLGGYKLGLLINFYVELLRDGIKRVINGTL